MHNNNFIKSFIQKFSRCTCHVGGNWQPLDSNSNDQYGNGLFTATDIVSDETDVLSAHSQHNLTKPKMPHHRPRTERSRVHKVLEGGQRL
jgi:hypothetical protein